MRGNGFMEKQKQKKKIVGLQKRKAKAGYVFIAPFIIGFLVFMIKPLWQSLHMSFCSVELGAGDFKETWVGITNFVYAFRVDPDSFPS